MFDVTQFVPLRRDIANHEMEQLGLSTLLQITANGGEATNEENLLSPEKQISSFAGERTSFRSSSKPYSSGIYQHFEDTGTHLVCKICRQQYLKNKTGSTSGPLRHMRNKHPTVLFPSAKRTVEVVRRLENKHHWPLPVPRNKLMKKQIPPPRVQEKEEGFARKIFHKKLISVLLLRDLPLSLLEDELFGEMLLYCHKDASPPAPSILSKNVSEMFFQEKERVKEELKKVEGKMSFIIDFWKAQNQHHFIGTLISYIDQNWELKHLLIASAKLEGPPSGKNLCESFVKVLEDFEVTDKVHALTMDNGSHVNKMCVELETYLNHKGLPFDGKNMRVNCLAHEINKACQNAVNKLNDSTAWRESTALYDSDFEDTGRDENVSTTNGASSVSKLRRGIVKILSSPHTRETYQNHCTEANVKSKDLLLDADGKWSSTFSMIRRAIEVKEAYSATMRVDAKLRPFELHEAELLELSVLVEFLQPFHDLASTMMDGKHPTISLCALAYVELVRHTLSYLDSSLYPKELKENESLSLGKPDCPKWLRSFARNVFSNLNEYFQSCNGEIYIIGTILDPRLKLEWHKLHFHENRVQYYRGLIEHKWEMFYKPKCHDGTTGYVERQDLFVKHMQKKTRIEPRNELAIYLDEKPVPPQTLTNIGALGWWKINEAEYPHLAKMARDYLATAGTGFAFERLLPVGNFLSEGDQTVLESHLQQQYLCLKSWLKSRNADFNKEVRKAMYLKFNK